MDTDPRSENRVEIFFVFTTCSDRVSWSQSVEAHQEIFTFDTTTASGRYPVNKIDPFGLGEEWAAQAGRIVDEAIANSTFLQMLFGRAGYNVDQNQRYIDTSALGTIDLQHVVSAAAGLPGTSTFGGYVVELNQLIHDQDSAFKTEDLNSNSVGGLAQIQSWIGDESIGEEVEQIIKDLGPIGEPYGR
jgi:hypothetical protein